MARSNAPQTGDQEIVGLIPAGSGFSLEEIDHEIFSMVILSLQLLQEVHVSFWQKNVHKFWLTA